MTDAPDRDPHAALAPDDLRQSTAFAPVAQALQDIVIVDVDDASLRELGRWP